MSRRKLTTSIAASLTAVALAIGGYAIASASSSDASSTTTTAKAGKAVPFHRRQPSPSTVVGRVPASLRPETGTIVTGTAANKAKSAAVAAYPGGIVNRVVLLSNGGYNVHMIGVNWPHHVFVSNTFKVVGAE